MPKKCIICGDEARYVIKETSDFYCQECAIECFNDTSLLQSVEEQARQLKNLVNENVDFSGELMEDSNGVSSDLDQYIHEGGDQE